MLLDPKSAALVDNFAGQWLELRNLDSCQARSGPLSRISTRACAKPCSRRHELFFEAVIHEDRSILDFIDGKFTFLNERLAKHYGIPGVTGPEFRRVELTGEERSGILTQASVLTVSSYPDADLARAARQVGSGEFSERSAAASAARARQPE